MERESGIIMVEESTNDIMTPIMKSVLSRSQSSTEVLIGLLQILMAECGLYPIPEFKPITDQSAYRNESESFFDVRILKQLKLNVPKNEDGVLVNSFLLRGYPEPAVRLLCDPQHQNVLVTALISPIKCIFSVMLKTNNYIIRTSKNQFVLLNMKSLSIKFKNTVALPARAAILNRVGVVNPSFEGLPDEILSLIWKYVPEPEFLSPSISRDSVFSSS